MTGLINSMTRELTLRRSLLVPLATFLLLAVFLWLGFGLKDPKLLPSALIDKPFPDFQLPDLQAPETLRNKQSLLGRGPALVNVWATWCPSCLVEHPELMRIAHQEGLPLYGVNYNDDPAKARAWLQRHGNPFIFSIIDQQGALVVDLGVYGAPETFIMDAAGVIRYRHVGAVTPDVWAQRLAPILNHLATKPTATLGRRSIPNHLAAKPTATLGRRSIPIPAPEGRAALGSRSLPFPETEGRAMHQRVPPFPRKRESSPIPVGAGMGDRKGGHEG